MGKLQFEYDEVGDKFCYFALGFYSLFLAPVTYLLWPSMKTTSTVANVHPEEVLTTYQPVRRKQETLFKRDGCDVRGRKSLVMRCVGLLVCWSILGLLVYNAATVQQEEVTVYDPFKVLDIDPGSTPVQIKAAYKSMVKLHHPDRGGDEQMFRDVTNAYKALTDETVRQNFERYGNPDGPGVMRFGIALPRWIIEGRNATFLLAAYIVLFIIGLPVGVGTWWYGSIKYTAEKVLVSTTRLYTAYLMRTPSMNMQRLTMILSGSLEFERSNNKEIKERPSDNEDVPAVMHLLSVKLNEKTKDRPFYYPYSVKARSLIYAYLARIELPSKNMAEDQQYIITKCPHLINEIVHIAMSLMAYGKIEEMSANIPTVDTIETAMKLSAMIVQALEERRSAFHQLPHYDKLRRTQHVPYTNLKQLAAMTEKSRRCALKQLSDDEYADLLHVLESMPAFEVSSSFEVAGGDEYLRQVITPDSIVTLNITLKRLPLLSPEEITEEERQRLLDVAKTAAKEGRQHRVFCPYFPTVKYERWWIYVVDRKRKEMIVASKQPITLKGADVYLRDSKLVSEITLELRFAAPTKPGQYNLQLNVRSDSYLDLDVVDNLKLTVVSDVTKPSESNSELTTHRNRPENYSDDEDGSDKDDSEDDLDDEEELNESDEYMTESDSEK